MPSRVSPLQWIPVVLQRRDDFIQHDVVGAVNTEQLLSSGPSGGFPQCSVGLGAPHFIFIVHLLPFRSRYRLQG